MAPRTNEELAQAQLETQRQIAKLAESVDLLLKRVALENAPGADRSKRIPLRMAQLKKTLTVYSLYATGHDTIQHDKPQGLRATLINDSYVYVEAPKHEKDRREIERIAFMVPVSDFSWIEPWAAHPQRLAPDELTALMKASIDRSNYLKDVEPLPPPPKAKLQAQAAYARSFKKPAGESGDGERGDPDSVAVGDITLGTAEDDAARAADEDADEAATLAEMEREDA